MDKLLAGLVLVMALGVLLVAIRVAGRAAGIALLVWPKYRGRFAMTLLLEESSEAAEDATPAVAVLLVLAGGALYWVGRLLDLVSVLQVGKVLMFLPVAGVLLWFAFNHSKFVNQDTGLNLMSKFGPRIRLLTDRLAEETRDPLLPAYRHAWRSKLIVRLLVLEDPKIDFSGRAREAYALLNNEIDLHQAIKSDLQAIGEPTDGYLKAATVEVQSALQRSLRKLERHAAEAVRPLSPTEKFVGNRLFGLIAFGIPVYFTVRLIRTAPFPPDRVKSAIIELSAWYLLALIIAAINARSRRKHNWFGPLLCFWLPPIALIWSLVLVLSGPTAPKTTEDEPVEPIRSKAPENG